MHFYNFAVPSEEPRRWRTRPMWPRPDATYVFRAMHNMVDSELERGQVHRQVHKAVVQLEAALERHRVRIELGWGRGRGSGPPQHHDARIRSWEAMLVPTTT